MRGRLRLVYGRDDLLQFRSENGQFIVNLFIPGYEKKALIVEDEDLARKLLKEYLKAFPGIDVAGEHADGFSALRAIREQKPDLVFLDLQMPKISGFEMLELLDDSPEIIFTKVFDQYAMKAFENNAVDYLLKPFSEDRFKEAVEKALNRISVHSKQGYGGLQSHIEKAAGITFMNYECAGGV